MYVSYNVASFKTVSKIVISCPNIYYSLMEYSLLDTGKKKMNLICPELKSLQLAGRTVARQGVIAIWHDCLAA